VKHQKKLSLYTKLFSSSISLFFVKSLLLYTTSIIYYTYLDFILKPDTDFWISHETDPNGWIYGIYSPLCM